MNLLNIELPSNESLSNALMDEFTVLDNNLNVVQSYFSGSTINKDGQIVNSGFVIYGYDDKELDEYIYMVIGFTALYGNIEIDEEFVEPGGFETIDEADEYLKSIHNVLLVESN